MKKYNSSTCIKRHCLDCAGSNKEVTLCHVFGCSLWQRRTGSHTSSAVYKTRMETAFKNNATAWKELELLDIKKEDFLP